MPGEHSEESDQRNSEQSVLPPDVPVETYKQHDLLYRITVEVNAVGIVATPINRQSRHPTIALKGAHKGLGRSEFEYTIPISDAEEILRTMCDDRVLEKVRNYVPYAGLTWEIDVYDGILKGVVIAEVELDREDRVLELPDWVGREITGDLRYSKFNMETAAKRGERFW
jgi:CYTH domain-containing protein